MIELSHDELVFSFPAVHPEARLQINFHRTLRIPDDGNDYPLPPGLGSFPLRHVDDFARKVPGSWLQRGGVMMPMYQSEALWMSFDSSWLDDRDTEYPFAIKIATGKINAVTGEAWSDGLATGPQDYLVAPEQPWLDGYCVEKGFVRLRQIEGSGGPGLGRLNPAAAWPPIASRMPMRIRSSWTQLGIAWAAGLRTNSAMPARCSAKGRPVSFSTSSSRSASGG